MASDGAKRRKPSDIDHFLAGLLGGTAAAVSTNWLEVVKTRQQSAGVSTAIRNMRVDRILSHIVKQEGFAGLFRGVTASIIGVGPARACQFWSYNKAKQGLASIGIEGTLQHALSACVGSFAASTTTSPVWVVKTRLQLQQDSASLGVKAQQATSTTASGKPTESPAGNAKRSFSTATGNKGPWGHIKRVHPRRSLSRFPSSALSRHMASQVSSAAIRCRNAAASLGNAMIQNPRRPIQAAAACVRNSSAKAAPTVYKGLGDAFMAIYREEGIAGFYRGLTASYLGAFESMIQFALYQQMKSAYLHVKFPGSTPAEGASGLATASSTTAGFSTSPSSRGRASTSTGSTTESTPSSSSSAASRARAAYRFGGLEAVVLGASAKLVAAASVYPQEVIRTRMREQRGVGDAVRYRGVVHCLQRVAAEEGMAGLYGGMPAHLIRVVPNAAVLFLVVETMLGGAV